TFRDPAERVHGTEASVIRLPLLTIAHPRLPAKRGLQNHCSAFCCGAIQRRMGIIEESTKPCFRKNACATFSGRSVSSVIRRKFFFFAKSIACSRSLLPYPWP